MFQYRITVLLYNAVFGSPLRVPGGRGRWGRCPSGLRPQSSSLGRPRTPEDHPQQYTNHNSIVLAQQYTKHTSTAFRQLEHWNTTAQHPVFCIGHVTVFCAGTAQRSIKCSGLHHKGSRSLPHSSSPQPSIFSTIGDTVLL